jgi:predicted dehydrogenase
MTIRIGIIGAENTHTATIANIINALKLIKGCSVDYVWGETPKFAKEAAKAGGIANVVKKPIDMLDKIDAVIVDHRHPKYHLNAVLPFVKKGIVTFVDKPFCYRAAKGKAFLKIAKQNGVPVTSHSALPQQKSYKKFVKKMEGIGNIVGGVTYGPCDIRDPNGGIFFYGIHQVDMVINAFGYNVSAVHVCKRGKNATAQLIYPDGKIVVMHCIKEGLKSFYMTAIGDKDLIHSKIAFDEHMHLPGTQRITKMFKTGKEPLTHAQILKPVQILEALEKSVKSGNIEKVERL